MTIASKYVPTIHIHPILIIFIIISFITGTFIELFIILSIVFIHELGHFIAAKYFNWRVNYIVLWVFGGVMKTDEHGNKTMIEEAIVTLAGPFQHIIIFGLIYILSLTHFVSPTIIEHMLYYNMIIFLFNILPIWPLDGGKLLFLFLSIILPYRTAYHTMIIFSLISSFILLLVQLVYYPFTLSAFLIMIFLLMENRTEWKRRYYVFIRFLLKRHEGRIQTNSQSPIVVSPQTSLMELFYRFRRDRKHHIYINAPPFQHMVIDERAFLSSYFDDKNYNEPIGNIVGRFV